jgi:hypothetical protein
LALHPATFGSPMHQLPWRASDNATATRLAMDYDSSREVLLKQRDSGDASAPSEPPLL